MTETQPAAIFGKAEALNFDPAGGKWVAVCQRHSTVINLPTRDQARAAASKTAEFCEACRDFDQALPDEPASIAEPAATSQMQPVDSLPTPEPFSPAQIEPVTDTQLDNIDGMLKDAAAEWLADEHAKQQASDEVIPNSALPIIGTFLAAGVAHHAVAISGQYMRSVCNPDTAIMIEDSAEPDSPLLCSYCMAGVIAPPRPVVERRRRYRRGYHPSVPAAPVEPMYPVLTEALLEATARLLAAIEDHPSTPDVVVALDIMAPAMSTLRKHAPRRRVGAVTGSRSGLVQQSKTVNPSDELDKVKAYADAGDARAQDILAHVAAYQAGEDCPYCLEHHNRSTRHGYATAFMSVGRELRAMEARATAASAAA